MTEDWCKFGHWLSSPTGQKKGSERTVVTGQLRCDCRHRRDRTTMVVLPWKNNHDNCDNRADKHRSHGRTSQPWIGQTWPDIQDRTTFINKMAVPGVGHLTYRLLKSPANKDQISKEMPLYFTLAVFCLFEARVPELDTQPLPPPPQLWMYSVHCILNSATYSGNLSSNWQNTSSPKYNVDISLLA
jgi:hypothetical protein